MPDSLQTKLKVNFDTVTERTSLESGENISLSLAKTKKYLDDLGNAAFKDIDSTPTEGSTALVTSAGIYTDQARQDALEAQDRAALIEVENKGAKNKFPYGDLIGITTNFSDQPISLPAGNYKLVFTSSASTGTFAVRLKDAQNNSIFYITADNATTTRTYDLNISEDAAKITFYSSVSNDFTDIMICTKAEYAISNAFVPFAKTNRELTIAEDEDRAALVELVDGSAKNLLDPEETLTSRSLRGVTVTRTGDVYNFSGTAEDNSNIFININNDTTINNLPPGDYVAIFEQVQSDIKLQVGINGVITFAGEFGQPLYFTIPSTATNNWIRFFFVRLVNYTGRNARIMICTKEEWDISNAFVPFAKTNSELTAEADYAINTGVKNLLNVKNSGDFPRTINGVTYNESNGIITTSDSATITTTLKMPITLDAGSYIISGCPANGSDSTYRIDMRLAGTNTVVGTNDYGNGFTLNVTTKTDYDCCIRFYQGASAANLTFKPMIRLASITDSTFAPYALPNPILTPALVELVDGGSKNVFALNPDIAQGGLNGLTPTFNSDGTVHITGTLEDNTKNGIVYLYRNFDAGSVSGFVLSGGISDVMSLRLQNGSSPYNTIAKSDGDGALIPSNSITNAIVYFYVPKTVTSAVDVTIKPMICSLSDWNTSHKYVPYKQSITWGFGNKIPQNSDFNSYTTPGVYRVENSTDAATMLHIPITNGGGRLEVKGANALNRIIQTYYISTSTFTRYYNGTAWSNWVQILSTATLDEIPTANSTNAVMSGGVQAPLAELVDNGAKNLLKNTLGSGTKSTIEYTTGTDGSIVITAGTAQGGNADFVIPFTPKESGQYVLQGCPSGGSGATYKGQIVLYPSMTNVVEIFDDTSVTATLTGGTQYAYRFRVYSGKAIGDVTIYPMVCSEAAWKISTTYQPYAKSNRETTLNIDGVDITATSDNHADLNNYTDTGLYIVRGSAIAQYIDNCPVSARGFALQVWNLGGSTCVQEIIDPDVSAAAFYIRRKISSSWRPWFKFEGTEVT